MSEAVKVAIVNHTIRVTLAALTFDELYTIVFWLILDRNARRASPHAELKYFGIIGQLSLETVVILYLIKQLEKTERTAPWTSLKAFSRSIH